MVRGGDHSNAPPHHNRHPEIKTDIQKITADVGNIKTDVQGIKDDVRTLKEGQAQVQHMAAIVSLSNLHSNTPHDPTNMF